MSFDVYTFQLHFARIADCRFTHRCYRVAGTGVRWPTVRQKRERGRKRDARKGERINRCSHVSRSERVDANDVIFYVHASVSIRPVDDCCCRYSACLELAAGEETPDVLYRRDSRRSNTYMDADERIRMYFIKNSLTFV